MQLSLPVVGATGKFGNVLYAAGDSGHGVGTQSFVGELLAEKINGVEHPYYAALQHEIPRMLPEPLRWLSMTASLESADWLDHRTNLMARARAGS